MGDTQRQSQACAQRHEIFLETQRTGGVGATGIEREDDFLGVGVAQMTVFYPGQFDGVADEGTGLARGTQGHEAGIVEIVVDAVRHEDTIAQMAEVVVVDVLYVRAVALTGAMQTAEQFLLLGIDAQYRIAMCMGVATQRVDEAVTLSMLRPRRSGGDGPPAGNGNTTAWSLRGYGHNSEICSSCHHLHQAEQ